MSFPLFYFTVFLDFQKKALFPTFQQRMKLQTCSAATPYVELILYTDLLKLSLLISYSQYDMATEWGSEAQRIC